MTDEYITGSALADVLERLGRAVGARINTAINPASARIAALEARVGALSLLLGGNISGGVAELQGLIDRVKSLESMPSLKYSGVWNADTQFNEGNIVTDHGSAWHCNRSTRARPGTNDDFTLMVKRGSEGKGSR